MLTQTAGGAADERPSPLPQYFSRLRDLATCSDLSPAQRESVQAALRGPLEDFCHACHIALGALDGPDPEMAIVYLVDAAATVRQALTTVDAQLS